MGTRTEIIVVDNGSRGATADLVMPEVNSSIDPEACDDSRLAINDRPSSVC
jgi:hypothetical protein